MARRALTGVQEGSFTRLDVLKDGFVQDVLDLLGEAGYDDSAIAQDVATNAAAIAGHGSALAQHATAISGKADASAVYSRATVDAMVAPQATQALTTLKFADIDSTGVTPPDDRRRAAHSRRGRLRQFAPRPRRGADNHNTSDELSEHPERDRPAHSEQHRVHGSSGTARWKAGYAGQRCLPRCDQ